MNNDEIIMYRLANFGSTCYINSILQILMHMPELTIALEPHKHKPIVELFIDICNGRDSLLEFVKRTNLGQGQQDMHEYLIRLLNFFHEECHERNHLTIYNKNTQVSHLDTLEIKSLITLARDTFVGAQISNEQVGNDLPIKINICDSPIYQLCTGQFHGESQCMECRTITNTFELFHVMEISMIETRENASIYDALKSFIKTETIEDYRCDKCKKKTIAYRRLGIWRPPQILILNIKRILMDGMNLRKDNSSITTPDILDISQYANVSRGSLSYDLFAIGYHVGDVCGGHCYAAIKINNGWVLCDDAKIYHVENLPQDNQYLIFYRRRKE